MTTDEKQRIASTTQFQDTRVPPFDWELRDRQMASRSFGKILVLFYLGTLVLFVYKHLPIRGEASLPGWGFLGIGVAILGLFGIDQWQDRRFGSSTPPKPVALAFLGLRLALIETVIWIDGGGLLVSALLYLVLPYKASLAWGHRAGRWVALATWVWVLTRLSWLNPVWYLDPSIVDRVVVFTIVVLFVITTARIVGHEMAGRAHTEQLLADLEVSHRKLTDYAAQVANLATVTERNRLARDIHDSLGHYLTVINVQLEKALAFRDKNPAEAERAVVESRRLAREALDDVRRSVSTLRNTEFFSLTQALRALAEPLRSSRLSIDLHIEGSEEGYARQTLLVLYRAAQEGLTNIQRHAQARHVTLHVRFAENEATLCVQDDGMGFELHEGDRLVGGTNGGYGLQGVRERLELIGGSMHIESRPGAGTRLSIMVPKDSLASISHATTQTKREVVPDEKPTPVKCNRSRASG